MNTSNKNKYKMQTITSKEYQFFRKPQNKQRVKTLDPSHTIEEQPAEMKQSIPVKIRRRNYFKDPFSQKPIKVIDFRGKKTPHLTNYPTNDVDPYKKYTEQFAIPTMNTQANAQSIDPIKCNEKDQKSQHQNGDFRISQQNPFLSIKKGSFSNNKSYEQHKRTATFTRKSAYSINSMERDKKTPLYFYPADKYKSLNSKDLFIKPQKQKNSRSLIDHSPDKHKDSQMLESKKNSFSISRNRYLSIKDEKPAANFAKNTATNKKIRHSSNTHSQQIIDNNLDKLIKKEFTSLSVKELNNQPVIRNQLDPMYLTEFQKEQIKSYKDIFYIGHKAYLRKYREQQNFRDPKNNYKPIIGDHIAYRFEITKILGSGAFGKVLEVIDHKSSESKKKKYALKILKKSEDLYDQFKLQIKILKMVKQNSEALKNIVEIKGDFEFRNHICIVTELLDLNVYAFIKNQEFEGLSLDITRKIMIQVLQALLFLHHKQIVHCDIKPQNIVFKEEGKSGVKLIDFGSACFIDKKEFTYIQSRYYRSPQIVLVKPYDEKIDVWSTGCLAYEIFTGTPLFPARCEQEQIQMLQQTLGKPPKHFLDRCERAEEFEFSSEAPKFPLSKRINPSSASPSFLDFMEKMIRWSPEERMTIKEALMHDFILEGLPEKVKRQHIYQMKSQNPYGLYLGWQ